MPTPKVILKPRRAQPFFGRHPWVFAGAIDRVDGEPGDGDEVELVSHGGNFIARGLFNSQSKIRVRLYSWEAEIALDATFFRKRLAQANDLRECILKLGGPERGYRVAFSESDYLSGIVVDRYGEWLAVQFTALGLAKRREMIADFIDIGRVRGERRRFRHGLRRPERGAAELHDPLRHRVDMAVDLGAKLIDHLVDGDELRPFQVPMRLLGQQGEIDRIGEPRIQ